MFLTFTKNVLWISLKNTFLDAGPKEEKSSLKIKSKNPQICKNLKKEKVFSKQTLKFLSDLFMKNHNIAI